MSSEGTATRAAQPRGRRILVLLTDAYGGHGGIALANRDVIGAMCADPDVEHVTVLPRLADVPIVHPIPDKVEFDLSALGGVAAYVRAVMRAMRRGPYDMVFCGHMNLLPVARVAASLLRVPMSLTIHGVEAWEPSARWTTRLMARRADLVMAVSGVTLGRFRSWAPYPDETCVVLPNAIHLEQFAAGPKNPAIEARYGLQGCKVAMTFGRIDATERYKGFDPMLEAMPAIIAQRPEARYMIAGDGSDRARLEQKAKDLGVAEQVVFTGRIAEEEKADHYRLADLYAMPSHGEGFGFVLLEAMACGIPAIGSTRDGTREAMREGLLGPIVDPLDRDALVAAVLAGFDRPRGVPAGLDFFAYPNFVARLNAVLRKLMARAPISPSS